MVQQAEDAGVWVFGAGLESQQATIVATDGTVTDGPYPETKEVLGGFAVVDLPSREDALEWAAKIAVVVKGPLRFGAWSGVLRASRAMRVGPLRQGLCRRGDPLELP